MGSTVEERQGGVVMATSCLLCSLLVCHSCTQEETRAQRAQVTGPRSYSTDTETPVTMIPKPSFPSSHGESAPFSAASPLRLAGQLLCWGRGHRNRTGSAPGLELPGSACCGHCPIWEGSCKGNHGPRPCPRSSRSGEKRKGPCTVRCENRATSSVQGHICGLWLPQH